MPELLRHTCQPQRCKKAQALVLHGFTCRFLVLMFVLMLASYIPQGAPTPQTWFKQTKSLNGFTDHLQHIRFNAWKVWNITSSHLKVVLCNLSYFSRTGSTAVRLYLHKSNPINKSKIKQTYFVFQRRIQFPSNYLKHTSNMRQIQGAETCMDIQLQIFT